MTVLASPILNYDYAELDLDKRNPFSRLIIKAEGEDNFKRGTFTNEQLKQGYQIALASGSQVKLLIPLLGETGCRLSEIVGLRLEDIDLQNELILVRPNPVRRLKTRNSQRTLPLVGYAKLAMEKALRYSDGEYLFPRYIKDGKSEEWRRHFNKIKKELTLVIFGWSDMQDGGEDLGDECGSA